MGKIIYHYCNVEAFRAIIQNKNLWLSSVYNLNDYKEIHWIKDKVTKKIVELKTRDNFLKYNYFEELYVRKLPTVYVASFSQGGDLLSQWRAYANDGFGVAIGFNIDYFKMNELVHTTEVLYDEEKQEKEIENILKPIENISNDIDVQSEYFKKECSKVIKKINYLSAKSKNELFKEEQEVRLIHNPIIKEKNNKFIFKNNLSKMKFRAVCGNLIPYFELDFSEKIHKDSPIISIVKGPKNKFINKELEMFLSLNGFDKIEIKHSKSSYR